MKRKQGFKFTNKKHSEKAIMATILGIISFASICIAVFLTFSTVPAPKGAPYQYGSAALLATLMAFAGAALGVVSRTEKDKFYLFSYIGIALNVLTLAGVSFILYAGAGGL